MRRARAPALVLALLAALALAAACGESGAPESGAAEVVRPMPANVRQGAEARALAAQGGSADTCDRTASLRPSGALPAQGAMPAGSTMRAIQRRGRLTAGVDPNKYRLGYRDPRTRRYAGFDVDIAHELALAIFGDRNRVQFIPLTTRQRDDALKSGSVDVVVNSYSITCARRQFGDFSSVYYTARQRLLVDASSGVGSIAELPEGSRVCTTASATSMAALLRHPVEPVATDDFADCLVLLQQGQVTAVSTDDAILAGLAAQDPSLRVVGGSLNEEPYGIGIPRGHADMVRFVNAVLDRMRADGRWQRLYDRWLASSLGPARPPAARYAG